MLQFLIKSRHFPTTTNPVDEMKPPLNFVDAAGVGGRWTVNLVRYIPFINHKKLMYFGITSRSGAKGF